MTDPVRQQLASHAAGIVNRVAAHPWRRHAMREELLAHLLAAVDEERVNRSSDADAACAAVHRFGDAGELFHQFQASVPRLEAALFACVPRKEDLVSRSFWACGIAAAAIGCVLMLGLAIVMPAAAQVVGRAADAGADIKGAANRLQFSLIALVLFSAAVTFGGLGVIGYGALRARRMRSTAA